MIITGASEIINNFLVENGVFTPLKKCLSYYYERNFRTKLYIFVHHEK